MYDERFLNRLLAKVQFTESCWLWTAYKLPSGYGLISVPKKYRTKTSSYVRAHRALYEICIGPIPPSLVMDHLCRNPACVNPDHLEPVTDQLNALRGDTIPARNAAKTHCPKGHPYSESNTYTNRNNQRQCRICARAFALRSYYRRIGRVSESASS